MSRQGIRYNLRAMASCASAAVEWGAVTSMRMRFERHFWPNVSIWGRVIRQPNTVTTAAYYACRANIDNVFWGDSQDVKALLQEWLRDLKRIETLQRHNPERGMCVAARSVGLTVRADRERHPRNAMRCANSLFWPHVGRS